MPSTITDRASGLGTGATPNGENATISQKVPCRVATAGNITLAGLQTLDTVTVVADDRVLVKDQTDASENGIYLASADVWQRTNDCVDAGDLVKGSQVRVNEGAAGAGSWYCTSDDPIVIGTDEITWVDLASTVLTGAEIKALYEAEGNTNAFEDTDASKLDGIESGATSDQTGAEIKVLYESQADTNAFTDAEQANLAAADVSTRTALKAINTSVVTQAYLNETGRAGHFVFRSGDYSSLVTADTQEGVFIKADDTATTSGAWVRQRDTILLNIEWFGAVGDGSTVNTTAIQAAIDLATEVTYSGVEIPQGRFVTSTVTIATSHFKIAGAGWAISKLLVNTDVDVVRLDITAARRDLVEFSDFGVNYTGVSAPSTGSAIRVYESTGTPLYGATHLSFKNLELRYTKYGVTFDRAILEVFGAFTQIAKYGQMLFDNIRIPSNADFTDIGIWFKGGPGAHNIFSNLQMATQDACVRMGGGGTDDGLGDQTFVNCHFLAADYAIDIIGPTGTGRYNQNVTITGSQFDGIATATVRMRDMKNFRIVGNNSTTAADFDLDDCENYQVDEAGVPESRYYIRPQSTTSGATTHNLFDIALLNSANFVSAYVEVVIDVLVGGVGARNILWRGFIRYNSGWNIHQAENYTAALGNATFAIAAGGAGVRGTLTLSGSTGSNRVDGSVKITSRDFRFVPL